MMLEVRHNNLNRFSLLPSALLTGVLDGTLPAKPSSDKGFGSKVSCQNLCGQPMTTDLTITSRASTTSIGVQPYIQ